MDRDYFSNLSFSLTKEAPHEILRSFEFSTVFPYKCMVPIRMHWEANLTSPWKGQTSMHNNYYSYFGRLLVPDDFAKIQPQGILGSGEEDF